MARNIARIKILALGKNYVARLQQLAHFHNLQNLARIAASGFAKEIWQNYKFSPVDDNPIPHQTETSFHSYDILIQYLQGLNRELWTNLMRRYLAIPCISLKRLKSYERATIMKVSLNKQITLFVSQQHI